MIRSPDTAAEWMLETMRISTDLILDLFDHMEWADALMWDAALKSDVARGDDRLRWLMLHLHGVQRAFLDAWTKQPFAFRRDYSGTTNVLRTGPDVPDIGH